MSNKLMTFRASEEQKAAIEAKALEYGFDSVGAYIKFACINAELSVKILTPISKKKSRKPQESISTPLTSTHSKEHSHEKDGALEVILDVSAEESNFPFGSAVDIDLDEY